MLNSSVQAASTDASTTGRYSGRQPAITALTAAFSTVQSAKSGPTTATTSSGARVVPSSIRSTRAGVGGTTGSPSVQPRSKKASASSSRRASSRRRERSPVDRAASRSITSGSWVSDPQPGRYSGSPSPSPATPVNFSQWGRDQPDQPLDLDPALHLDQRGDRLEVEGHRHVEVGVVDRVEAFREGGVVLREDRERHTGRPQLAQHGRHELAGGAVGLDDGDDPLGEWGAHLPEGRPPAGFYSGDVDRIVEGDVRRGGR